MGAILDYVNLMTVAVVAACIVGGLVAGWLLRRLFGRLSRPSAPDLARTWGQFGWNLLHGTAVPIGVAAGLWAAAEVSPLAGTAREVLDRMLLVVVALAVIFTAARVAGTVVGAVAIARAGAGRGGALQTAAAQAGAAESASIFVNITRVAVVAVGLLVLLQTLGVSITPMLTALGVGGLAVALALQDTLANLFGGLQILVSKKVQTGDFIRLDSGEDGYVVDINWRNTSVRQLAGNIVVIPNSRFADAVMTNFHQPRQDLAVLVDVGVSYDSDLDQVERVTSEVGREVMLAVEGAVPDHEPFIRYHTFADHSINFTVILRAREFTAQFLIKHEFIKRLHLRYRAERIEIPYPIRTLMMRDGQAGQLPAPRGSVAMASGRTGR